MSRRLEGQQIRRIDAQNLHFPYTFSLSWISTGAVPPLHYARGCPLAPSGAFGAKVVLLLYFCHTVTSSAASAWAGRTSLNLRPRRSAPERGVVSFKKS